MLRDRVCWKILKSWGQERQNWSKESRHLKCKLPKAIYNATCCSSTKHASWCCCFYEAEIGFYIPHKLCLRYCMLPLLWEVLHTKRSFFICSLSSNQNNAAWLWRQGAVCLLWSSKIKNKTTDTVYNSESWGMCMIFCFFSLIFSTARTVSLNTMSFTWLNQKITKRVLARFLIVLTLSSVLYSKISITLITCGFFFFF